MSAKQRIYFWGPVFFWCLIIFTFSSIPTLPKVGFIWWDFVLKKSAHMIEFGILFFLVWRALSNSFGQKIPKVGFFWATLIFCILYAISDEYHQGFIPGRSSRVFDVGFDTLGMILSWRIIVKRKRSKADE